MKQQKRVQPTKKNEVLSYSVEVRDKKGRVIQRISAPSRSYVEQWNQLFNLQATFVGKDIRNTDGDIYSMPNGQSSWLWCDAGIGIIVRGIRVGKGTTAVAIDDYALETPCGEGVGVDEFNHQATVFTVPAVVGSTCSFTYKRIMVNNSGATISGIKEIGNYVNLAGGNYALAFRDVLPGAVTVPDGGSITVTYTIAATV